MAVGQDYRSTVETSERVAWKVEDVLGSKPLDFSKAFLPESLAGVEGIKCLSAAEKLKLNQIRAHSYAHLFDFIEESIIAGINGSLAAAFGGDDMKLRALLRFLDEEVKHQQLFRRFGETFRKGFGSPCGLLEEKTPAKAVAKMLGSNPLLAVMITILHIEWVSQRHFVEGFRDSKDLEATFTGLLKYHWLEEAQHTKVDLLLIDEITKGMSPEEIEKCIEAYMAIGGAIDGLLAQQVNLDVASLEKATRPFSAAEREEITKAQHKSCQKGLLWMGMTNPSFARFLSDLSKSGAQKVSAMAAALA